MASTTLVLRLDDAAGRRLYESLGAEVGYAFRSVPYANWSARGDGVSVTHYKSGKLVVQGNGATAFADRYLDAAAAERAGAATSRESTGAAPRRPEIGSDESGKGDYFGPLVVAAALVRPEDAPALVQMGVRDSKAASDGLIRKIEGTLAERVPHAVRVLEPETYNQVYAEERNLNRLLGRLHAEVIDEVVSSGAPPNSRIVVDRFGDPQHVRRNLSADAKALAFVMPTGGESNLCVAAGSFLARAAFLRSFERLSGLAGGDLPKGASDPRVLTTARRLLREGGEVWLGAFAKLHFKTTRKAQA